MYSLNGIPLDSPARGWSLRAPTEPLSKIARDAVSLRITGRDGVVAGLPAPMQPVPLKFVVETPKTNLEALYALWVNGPLYVNETADATRRIFIELLSLDPVGYGNADWLVDVEALVRIPSAVWRDTSESTSAAMAISSSSVQVSAFATLSAPVADAQFRIKGSITGLRVTDSRGSWFTYAPNVPAGKWLIVIPEKGIARIAGVDNWDDYETDVSGSLDFGGPRGWFEVTPSFSDPATRQGVLTVTSTARSAATIQVRGRGAYLV